MNAITSKVQWVLNNDGVTSRCAGKLQYPQDRDAQKRVGLIAVVSHSLHGRIVKTSSPQ